MRLRPLTLITIGCAAVLAAAALHSGHPAAAGLAAAAALFMGNTAAEPGHDFYCSGWHDDGDDCVSVEACDPRCLGHYGVREECTPCGEPHCVEHDVDAGQHQLCGIFHCSGHEWEPDDQTLYNLAPHAVWCDGDDDEDTECDGRTCTLGGTYYELVTILDSGRSYVSSTPKDCATPEEINASVAEKLALIQPLADEIAYVAAWNAASGVR